MIENIVAKLEKPIKLFLYYSVGMVALTSVSYMLASMYYGRVISISNLGQLPSVIGDSLWISSLITLTICFLTIDLISIKIVQDILHKKNK